MANGFVTLSGTPPADGGYNPVGADARWRTLTRIYYVWDTAIGSAFTAAQFNDMFTGGFQLIAGLWRCKFQCARAAVASETATSIAVSTNLGNTTTDHIIGKNEMPLGETAAAVASGTVEALFYSATAFLVSAKAKQSGASDTNVFTGSFLAEYIANP